MARIVRMLLVAALVALPVPMAVADHKGAHGGGPAVTEDNDADGVANNIADPGDNMHPSGKDRSVEKGGSGNQGNSRSDPDGMENGGADKPGGTGGEDPLDQDGNNGCGNDDDFEDDNNGWCGKPVENQRASSARGAVAGGSIGGGDVGTGGAVAVLGELATRGAAGESAEVLGVLIGRGGGAGAVAGDSAGAGLLAFTGGPVVALVLGALILLALGVALLGVGRRQGRHAA